MRRIPAVACFAVAVLASGCGGSSQTYSIEEAKAAFGRHGYVLETAQWPTTGSLERDGQAILAPARRPGLLRRRHDGLRGRRSLADYERLEDDDSFVVRRANVALFADDGVSPSDRKRVLAALETLSDRDAPVLIAGD